MPTNESPADVAKRIKEWLGLHGRENSSSLLLYEAMQALERCGPSPAPVELAGVSEVIAKGVGTWRPCTGCYETEDGHPVGKYAHSEALGSPLGSGCDECGGIGAVWDNTDYEEMAAFMVEQDRLRAAGVIDLNDSQLLDVLDEEISERNLRWVASDGRHPCIGTAPGAERHGFRDAMRALLVLMRASGGVIRGGFKFSDEFQSRVQPWMMACFGPEIAADAQERNHRFLEEALELVQACGATASEAHQLVDYVYGRPVGDKHQEIGGVMVTLAALCLAQGQNMHAAGDTELARIWTKVEQIRAKQAAKPKHSPLPEHPAVEPAPMEDGWQVVPKVPTQAMRDAGFDAIPGILCCLATNVWDAMIAAAPTRQEGHK